MAAAPVEHGPAEERRVQALDDLGIVATQPEERFDRITRLAQQLFAVPTATITLIDHERQWVKSAGGAPLGDFPRSDTFCDVTIRRAGALVIEDIAADPRFADNPFVIGDPHHRFYAGHPLEAPGGERVGTLCLLDGRPRTFSERELSLLQEFALWAETELARSAEMERAAEVQRALLPRSGSPDIPGYAYAWMCRPSRAVGGDLVDWYRTSDDDVAFTLGDVMGKGIPAAIMMASVRAAMRTAGRLHSPGLAVQHAAATLDDDLQETATLVTLCHTRLTPRTGRLVSSDAGHGLMLIVRADGSLLRPPAGGLPLGVTPDGPWPEDELRLEPGDLTVAFSDGLLDLYPGIDETFTDVARIARHDPDVGRIIAYFQQLADRGELADDVAVTALRRCP